MNMPAPLREAVTSSTKGKTQVKRSKKSLIHDPPWRKKPARGPQVHFLVDDSFFKLMKKAATAADLTWSEFARQAITEKMERMAAEQRAVLNSFAQINFVIEEAEAEAEAEEGDGEL